ncbi:MAG: glycosyltransferase family protein [Candidatus Binatia bacterium]
MGAILYYITGHGYGHAVRSNQVILALHEARPHVKIHVRTTAPEWLFGRQPGAICYSPQAIDVGIIQNDSLEMNFGKTIEDCQQFYAGAHELVKQEASFISKNDIKVIVGDIPPLAFEIAAYAVLPSVAISNFSWDEIYRAYIGSYADFAAIVDQITTYYQKTTLALTLPYSCDMTVFPNQREIPWVTRTSGLTKDQSRAKFGLPHNARIILLSFGGHGLDRLPWDRLKQLGDFYFVATGESGLAQGNLRILSGTQSHYEDLVRAVDAIVTKPGYGIVADALAHKIPMLYTDRGEFPEYPRLVKALRECATAKYIAQAELLAGNIAAHLNHLLSKPQTWVPVDLDGATVAAKAVLGLFDQQR